MPRKPPGTTQLKPPVNVLILGAGGREHALGWKLKQSKKCGKLYFAPGNGGTESLGTNVKLDIEPVSTKTVDAIDYFCRHHDIQLVVVGPEDPLAQGIVDRLAETPGAADRLVFGPTAAGARLEADKAYAKQLMRAAAVPTAEGRTFTDFDAAVAYIESRESAVVVKAAGLAKGKGVVVPESSAEAIDALRRMMVDEEFGDAGATVVMEEKLLGQEVSVLALVDGRTLTVLDPAQDHKQVGEGDTGPNTGGMGAYCPTPVIDPDTMYTIEREVLVPMVDMLRRDDVDFRGVLYAGLMLTAAGPKVLEFNCRFGDPECQPLMARMKGDLLDVLAAVCTGRLDQVQVDWDPRTAVCVVLASGGYPGDYAKGLPITGIDDAQAMPGITVFHAGTARREGQLVTAGGRVLSVVALGHDLADAQAKANEAASKIQFDGVHYRSDIGSRVM
jgi:phosphoribosylamine--glycine ligase